MGAFAQNDFSKVKIIPIKVTENIYMLSLKVAEEISVFVSGKMDEEK